MRRRRKPASQHQGMTRFKAGIIALVVITVGTYIGWTKTNPFSSPYKLTAYFETANNLKPNSPVRIAGVEIGKVTKIESVANDGTPAAKVEMEIKDKGLPIHEDAHLKVRPRIFLEGNFFVDVEPGSPSAPIREDDGKPIPVNQTAAPVQLTDVLASLKTDTREDLQTFLKEYVAGLEGEGAKGFNEALKNGKDAYRYTAIANDAALGLEPEKDLQRILKGQQKTFGALAEDEEALKGLITNFNVVAGALAGEDVALEASIPALRDLLRTGSPALASLNSALPSLRRFAVEALPGVKSSGPALEATLPFIKQLRGLFSEDELQATAKQLRTHAPNFVALVRTSVPLFAQGRALSACTNKVLVPFVTTNFPDPDFPENSGTVNQKLGRGLVGLSGESRQSDGNQSYFHTSAIPLALQARPAPPTNFGDTLPPRRPDQPCENQQTPDLNAPAANYTPAGTLSPRSKSDAIRRTGLTGAKRASAFKEARKLYLNWERDGRPGLKKKIQSLLKKTGGSPKPREEVTE